MSNRAGRIGQRYVPGTDSKLPIDDTSRMHGGAGRQKLRVLTLIDELSTFGGAESVARDIALNLDRSRFEVTFCATRTDGALVNADALRGLEQAGIEFLPIARSSRTDVSAWRPLVDRLRSGAFDVLHAHKFGSNAWGSVFARWPGVPVLIAHEHGSRFEGRPVRRWFDRRVVGSKADVFVAVSEDDRRRIIEIVRVPESRVRLIPNGISELPPSSRDVRRELGIPGDAPVVGSVATFRREKALDVLVRVVDSLRDDFPSIRLLLAGGPEPGRPGDTDLLERLVRELRLEANVHFLGLRSDLSDLLAAIDVGVLCSEREASPLSVMEYMDAGLPVVATRVGGIPEIVIDGETGLLVAPRDRDELRAAIASVLQAPQRAKAMGERGRVRRRTHFTIELTARRVGELYEELWEAAARGESLVAEPERVEIE